MADYQKLRKGIQYHMTVVRTELKPRTFTKQGSVGVWYNHLIYFEDVNGVAYKGEYIIQSESQFDFMKGKEAVFYVVREGEIGDEIQPGILNAQAAPPAEYKQESRQRSSGHPATFAMAYAKDIYVAQINSGLHMGESLEKLFSMAREISKELVNLQSHE